MEIVFDVVQLLLRLSFILCLFPLKMTWPYHRVVCQLPVLSLFSISDIKNYSKSSGYLCRWQDSDFYWKSDVYNVKIHFESTVPCGTSVLLAFWLNTVFQSARKLITQIIMAEYYNSSWSCLSLCYATLVKMIFSMGGLLEHLNVNPLGASRVSYTLQQAELIYMH